MPGTVRAFQVVADAGDTDGRDKARRVHLLDRRREDEIDTGLAEFREIGGLATRIGGEILSRPELLRIDKERGDHALAVPARGLDQCQMAAMQRAHRRHQRDPLLLSPPAGNGLAQCRHRPRHGDIARRHAQSPPVSAAGEDAFDHRLCRAEVVRGVG